MSEAEEIMAMAEPHLIDRLPRVLGRMTAEAPLAGLTWLRVGGPAEVLFRPADPEDLQTFLAGCPADVPVTVIGVASNLLIRDGGIPGVVVRFGRGFAGIDVEADGVTIRAGAGALDLNVARVAQEAGIGGLAFLSGIPGTIGGGVRMNAGAFGAEFADVTVSADLIDRDGSLRTVPVTELGLTYRHSAIPADSIVTGALLRGHRTDPVTVAAEMADIAERRAASQPLRTATGGSTFANPPGARAWELIDRAGCRGLRLGQAQVSEKHCNFLINLGGASADDLEKLGEEVRRRVHEVHGITLTWEIQRVGVCRREDRS